MNVLKNIVLLIVTVFQAYTVYGQDVSATVSKNRVAAGEAFRLIYTINNRNMDNLILPRMSDFRIVGGPFQSINQSVINGVSSSQIRREYTIQAVNKGKFIIGGATIQSGGKSFVTNSVEIEVTDAGAASNGGTQPKNQTSNTNSGVANGSDLFIVLSVNKQNVYVGEQVSVTFRLYSIYNSLTNQDATFPSYTGAWVQDIENSQDQTFSIDNYNGKRYLTAVLRKSILIPQDAGIIELGPMTAKYLVQTVERTGDPFQDFFGGVQKQFIKNIKSNVVKLNVKALPQNGKPAGYRNATGDFSIQASVDKTKLAVNDAITLKIKVSGEGNLMLLEKPGYELPQGFESYEPKVKDAILVKESGISGSRTYELVGIARSPGTYVIPSYTIDYFNPAKQSYASARTEPMTITVEGESAGTEGGILPGRRDVDIIGEDIRYIKNENSVPAPDDNRFPTLWVVLLLLPVAVNLALFLYRPVVSRRQGDEAGKRFRSAAGTASRRLKQAREAMNKGDRNLFYEECYKALHQFLSDRYSLGSAEISKEKLRTYLQQRGLSETLSSRWIETLERCEFARFAPGSGDSELTSFLQNCERCIQETEKL